MLAGQAILIVETEFLIALEIERCLETFGASRTVFARSTREALASAQNWSCFGVALVEVHPNHDEDLALLRGLQQAGVKLVVMASDSAARHSFDGNPAAPVIIKPFSEDDLASAISRALATGQNE
jgi:CheY-like chemotaxis protein